MADTVKDASEADKLIAVSLRAKAPPFAARELFFEESTPPASLSLVTITEDGPSWAKLVSTDR